MGYRRASAEHIDRRLLQRAGALGRGHHDRAAAIGHEADVADRKGIADHPRHEHVGDRQRLLLPGGRVQQRPLPCRDRDLGHLLARRAVLVHVARGRHRVGGRRQKRAERRLVRVDLAHRGLAAADAALRAAIGDHRDLAQAELDRRQRMRDMKLERRAAKDRRVDIGRRNSEILGERQAGGAACVAAQNSPSTSRRSRPASSSARAMPCAIRSMTLNPSPLGRDRFPPPLRLPRRRAPSPLITHSPPEQRLDRAARRRRAGGCGSAPACRS